MLLAAASEPARGWGGPIALVVAFVVFRLFALAYTKIKNPSPPPPPEGGSRQITAGRSRFAITDTPADPGPDPTADRPRRPAGPTRDTTFPGRDTASPGPDPTAGTSWWGPIVERGGRRFRAAVHIARTGESPPAEPEPARDDFDDALDLVAEPEPDDLDTWLGWAAGLGYNERIRRAVARFGVSESSVKRRIRELRDEED